MKNVFSANLFKWLQNQKFYHELHKIAVDQVPCKHKWYDIGTSAGLIPALVSEKGIDVTGFDINIAAIEVAQKQYPNLDFKVASLEELVTLKENNIEVVSLSSLLFVMSNKQLALDQAYSLLQLHGKLVIIESSKELNFKTALLYCLQRFEIHLGLLLWGFVRDGNSVESHIHSWLTKNNIHSFTEQKLLNGLVKLYIITKK